MIKRLLNNLFMIKNYSNCYVIQFEDHSIVVDAGMDKKAKGLLEVLERVKKPEAVLITHAHLDHINGLAKLKEKFPEIKFFCSEKAKQAVEGKEILLPKGLERFFFKFLTFFVRYKPVEAEAIKESFEAVKVFETPGHTNGCISFLLEVDEKKVLFCGDLLINQRGLSLPPSNFNFNEKLQIESINKILKLDWDWLLPGHGEVLTEKTKIKEFLEKFS
ncbi:MAG: MBL fold metallo-hydrolase [Candidatus Aenigmatarchaeota archaeon]